MAPDDLIPCSSCMHDVRSHGCDGCQRRDPDGNRCACVWSGTS